MKKILILLFTMTFLMSCSKDENSICLCTLEVTIDGNGSYFVTDVPTDCNGNFERPSSVPQNHFLLGLRDCE